MYKKGTVRPFLFLFAKPNILYYIILFFILHSCINSKFDLYFGRKMIKYFYDYRNLTISLTEKDKFIREGKGEVYERLCHCYRFFL